jgi:dTDP-glucose pyrophosphorylase
LAKKIGKIIVFMNILIPMAGNGSRFSQAGYTLPKPLIDVQGKPMIQVVVDCMNLDANYIFIVQKEHREKYDLDFVLNSITKNCQIVETDGVTEGAACTALLAKEYINNDEQLIISNSDHFIDWDSAQFLEKMQTENLDGGILTFEANHPKWSYVKTDSDGFINQVAEKEVISNHATAGIYYWKHGKCFVECAEQMISKNIRVNNEFYVCPVFNQAIECGSKIKTFDVNKMWGLGTPEDLRYFLDKNEALDLKN